MKCKYCGKEKQAGEFDKFFTEEAIEDMFCSPACKQKHIDTFNKETLGIDLKPEATQA
jgi:hypothetical protein